ncbi:ribokinase [Deinococcus metallilatus]|uniref:Ribokinase n=1 Tax=Deinococcus metallilatus TaxID=1211322 RepID=A0AAJ5JYT1_9DEIO|nr:ribokinase [Deinococcus metallilatus]MBB5294063.1 ribokinase [Deinococcus metallilatus]QBY08851.1 ribokinase [Deinococcus metallilatus]RXJ09995.1 ribokinase [Deinococcus metallilatus]TLK28068.1 ribokinase [Deinococcus metallilatus]GMA16602.1 ribokinase [Deinococcus metallilatus]
MSVLVVGSVNADVTVRAARIPAPGETVLGEEARVSPGGKGANQAVAAALAGSSVTLCGAVGRDTFRAPALSGLTRAGVDLAGLHELDAPTGLALITVAASGENAITVASGANARVTSAHLPTDLSGFTHLLLQNELPSEVNREAARRAHAAGLTVLHNAAPARQAPMEQPDPELLAHTHHLIVNEHELAAFASGGGEALETQARALLTRGPRAVTVTLGAQGSLTVTADAVDRLPAFPVTPVDTTGAGDTFCGVLTAWLAQGHPLPTALHAAGVAAALACTRPGAQDAMPDRAEIAAALAR